MTASDHTFVGDRATARAAVFDSVEMVYNWQHSRWPLGHPTPVEARAAMEGISALPAA